MEPKKATIEQAYAAAQANRDAFGQRRQQSQRQAQQAQQALQEANRQTQVLAADELYWNAQVEALQPFLPEADPTPTETASGDTAQAPAPSATDVDPAADAPAET